MSGDVVSDAPLPAPVWESTRLAVSAHFLVEPGTETIFLEVQLIVHLESQPELRGHIEVASESKRGVCGHPTLAEDDLVYAPRRNTKIAGQPILAQLHRPEKLLQEDLAGVDRV